MALLPVSDALVRILAGVEPSAIDHVPLRAANGRSLAADVPARLTQPPFDCSAMDGFAVRAADVTSAPARLLLVGESAAGHGFAGTVGERQCVRISTGAPIPAGADCVVIQENTQRQDAIVVVHEAATPGQHVRKRGFDFTAGQPLIERGRRLEAHAIALAAAAGHASLPVRRKPVVAILASGDELVEPSQTPAPSQIVSSNSYGLAALVDTAGGDPKLLGIARDDPADLADGIAAAGDADILVTVGGASVGDHDLVAEALVNSGLVLDFWRIAMRPGKPLMFGRRGTQRVLGLPGNPVSCLVTARVFLLPLLSRMLGRPDDTGLETAVLTSPLEANDARQHYMRASLQAGPGMQPLVTPLTSQDSGALSLLAAAQCLIVRPPHAAAAQPGAPVDILRLAP